MTKFCSKCGTELANKDDFCKKCGASQGTKTVVAGQKSKMAAGLLGIFFGGLGIHNFYLGYNNKAVWQLVLCLAGGIITCGIASIAASIWGLVEGIQILTGSINCDADGRELGE